MKIPCSFEEVAYFKNEYRGDLIVTKGVLYYFPHTRVVAARFSDELGVKETMSNISFLGELTSSLGALYTVADKSIKLGKFLRRAFRPTTNSPQIKKLRLWRDNETSETLQKILDSHIEQVKKESLNFDRDAVPKPMRFAVAEMQNISFGLKFKFDAKFDSHDFRVNLLHRKLFKTALQKGGFLK